MQPLAVCYGERRKFCYKTMIQLQFTIDSKYKKDRALCLKREATVENVLNMHFIKSPAGNHSSG